MIDAAIAVHTAEGKVNRRDRGPEREDVGKRGAIGDSLPQGSSAIIAIAEDHVVERLQRGLEGYHRIASHASAPTRRP